MNCFLVRNSIRGRISIEVLSNDNISISLISRSVFGRNLIGSMGADIVLSLKTAMLIGTLYASHNSVLVTDVRFEFECFITAMMSITINILMIHAMTQRAAVFVPHFPQSRHAIDAVEGGDDGGAEADCCSLLFAFGFAFADIAFCGDLLFCLLIQNKR